MTATKSVAVVSGASQGLRRATAVLLARDVSIPVLVARDKGKLENSRIGYRIRRRRGDDVMRPPQSVEAVVKGTLKCCGRIDALLNIADAVPRIDMFEVTDTQWDEVICVDLRAHGRSGTPASADDHFPYSKRAMAKELVEVAMGDACRRAGDEEWTLFS